MSIRLFDKTPPGVVCPHFYILNWARGCPYRCSYCYLALTHRIHGNSPHFYDWPRIDEAIDKFFHTHEDPALLNTGELADSLMNPRLMEKICDKFEQQARHKVLLLSKGCRFPRENYGALDPTKGTAINFLRRKKYKQTIVSFSVNAHEFAEVYEKAAPTIYNRLHAAYLLQPWYEVRLRIDPIIPMRPPNVEGYSWKTAYRDLARFIFRIMYINPQRVTLGSPRWFPALPYWLKRAGRKDDFFDNFSRNKELCCDHRYRLKNRLKIYQWMISTLRKYRYNGPIALCKETIDVWKDLRFMLGMLPEEILCNCTL